MVPPQESSGLVACDYEAIVQNISTSVTQKRGSYQQHSKTNKLLAYSYYWFLNTDCFLEVVKRSPSKAIKLARRCRPWRLSGLAKIIQIFLKFTTYIWIRSWARRLYNGMGFVWKTAKTVKVDIVWASKECELTFLSGIVNKVEKFEIPPSLVLNLGQIKHNRNLSHHLKWNILTHETYLWWKNCSKFT